MKQSGDSFLQHMPLAARALAYARLATAKPFIVLVEHGALAEDLAAQVQFFDPSLDVFVFPDWEILPYDPFSPDSELVSERLNTLAAMASQRFHLVFAPVSAALQRLAPPSFFLGQIFVFEDGMHLSPATLKEQLAIAGYTSVREVLKPGEFAVRGGLVDVFPMGASMPFRLEFEDNTIASLRTFDPETQRTIKKVKNIRFLPGREFPNSEQAIARFREKFRAHFLNGVSSSVYKEVSNGHFPPGIDYYLPLFCDSTASLFDYAEGAHIVVDGQAKEAASAFLKDTKERYAFLSKDPERYLLPPLDIYLGEEELFHTLKNKRPKNIELPLVEDLPNVAIDRKSKMATENLKNFLTAFPGKVLFITDNEGRTELLRERLATLCTLPQKETPWHAFFHGKDSIGVSVAPLALGFILQEPHLAIITESDLYPDYVRPRAEKKVARAGEAIIKELGELAIGCAVVHDLHGIGRYLGLEHLRLAEAETEFLVIEYAGGDKLYVPVEQLALVSRYIGVDEPVLHKLGSGQWEKARQKAWAKARDTAAELLEIYAKRHLKKGSTYSVLHEAYEEFCAAFPFEETEDQKKAIDAVFQDLEKPAPMDRLVCGDVGFGKTEVAMRAAFVVAMQGAQVAVLVPTTLLAEQHFTTFSDRFANWPLKIAELSRFRSEKEQKAILDDLKKGKIDIVIGTHKLLQDHVNFKNLGLLIIDEEHRFGVRQKEKMKALRTTVDMLTLTATPIPRSIAMAIEGIKGLSLITTPPRKRLSVKTFVYRHDKGLAREAIVRELHRGGQVYYLHNDIDTIERHAENLRILVPEAKIRVAHGQMPERELETIMRDFYLKRFNVLVCTTIIESGIDIPSANTILVDRADRFGLAQLHQLRGRVGRSHHQAYCYLFISDWKAITPDAKKRLEAIQSLTSLGSGFQLAMHDLEIRGAGEILGEAQSGQVAEIGMQHYSLLLEKAVASLKNGALPEKLPETVLAEIKLHAPSLLPEDYCPDTHERLIVYKRLAKAENEQTLRLLQEEIKDRFGQQLPPSALLLFETHRLRLLAERLHILKIDATPKEILVVFGEDTSLDPALFLQVLEKFKPYRFSASNKLHLFYSEKDPFKRAQWLYQVLSTLFESIICASTPLSKAVS